MTISVQEFAAKIKAKYPEYKNVDDRKLSEAIVKKYPEYADKVDLSIPQQGVGEEIKGFMQEQAKGFQQAAEKERTQGFGQGLMNVGSQALQGVAETAGGLGDVLYGGTVAQFNPMDTRTPLEKSRLGVEGINKMISGVGKTITAPAAVSPVLQKTIATPFEAANAAIYSGLQRLGFNPQSQVTKDIAESTLNGLILGTMLKGKTKGSSMKEAVDLTKHMPSEISKGTKVVAGKVAEKGYEAAIPMGIKEAELMQKFKAGTLAKKPNIVADTARKQGIAGTETGIGVQAEKVATNLWKNEIAPVVRGIKKPIKSAEFIDMVKTDISKLSDPSRKSVLNDALQALKEDFKSVKSATLEEWQKIKSEKANLLPQKAWRGKELGAAWPEVNKMFTDAIRQKTYDLLSDVGIKEKYLDWGNLQTLKDIGTTAMTGSKLKGGAGSFVSALMQKASLPALTTVAKILQKYSEPTGTVK